MGIFPIFHCGHWGQKWANNLQQGHRQNFFHGFIAVSKLVEEISLLSVLSPGQEINLKFSHKDTVKMKNNKMYTLFTTFYTKPSYPKKKIRLELNFKHFSVRWISRADQTSRPVLVMPIGWNSTVQRSGHHLFISYLRLWHA